MHRPTNDINETDENLLARYQAGGDGKLLGILLQRYTLLLLGVAMKYLKDKTLAEDAVQQVFMKTLTNLPRKEIRNFKGWLYILIRNHCLQYLKHEKHHIEIDKVQLTEEHGPGTNEYTEQDIYKAMELLPEEQKDSVVLFYIKRMTYQEIMERTGYSFMQVKSYIQNGKRNLKNYLTAQKKEHD